MNNTDKTKEQALLYNEKKLREMTEFLPGVVYECDAQGNLNFVNRVAFKTFGYTREDFDKGVNAQQFIAISDRKRAGENIEKVLRGIDNGPFEYIAQRKDNSEFPIVVYSSPIVRKGKPVGIRGIIIDITESKQAEKKFIQKNEQMELVMHGANIGWWDWNILSGKEIYNEILLELLGYEFNEIESNIEWRKDRIHPDDLKQVNIDLQEHFDGKTEFYINEHRLKTKTGEWKWFFDHGKVVSRDKDGKPIRMIGTLRDIDKQQLAEKALQERNNELEAFYRATLGREGRVIELKQEVNELLVQLGKNKKYESTANN